MDGCLTVLVAILVGVIICIGVCMIPVTHSSETYELACMRVNDNNFYINGSMFYIDGNTYSTYVFYIKKGNERIRYEVKTSQCRIYIKENCKKVIIYSSSHPTIEEDNTTYVFYLDEKYMGDRIIVE